MKIERFEDIIAWQKAKELSIRILCKTLCVKKKEIKLF